MRLNKLSVLFAWLLLGACNQETLPEAASNLLAVDDVAFVCTRLEDGGNNGIHVERGVPLHECTERENLDGYALLALATQWETGEIAVLDATSCARPNDSGARSACLMRVLDNEASLPGINFLPVGAQPVSVLSTPGGTATFVAVAEPGKTGIFALPSTCVGQRKRTTGDLEAVRDIRNWPACRLPVAPSMLELIRDTDRDTSCDGETNQDVQSDRECPADLLEQESRQGRLKLAVTLPELGQLWTLDAQQVLDREPGSYSLCQPEQVVQLSTERPEELVQELPSDLSSEARVYTELGGEWQATPTDIAVDINASHGEVYIADRTAPLVHVLDASDACAIQQKEPLYPLSYLRPEAVVATRKVALSPVIDSGKRFVYAVEESSERTAGSIMVFDVSADVSQRTPLVLPRSPLITSQPPDRIQLSQEVSDVDFVYRDPPVVDPETGIGATGVRCDPDPDLDPDSPAARVRPNSSGTGAGPLQLRGLFAFASVYAGSVSVIDIDDYDAACRRPSSVNQESTPDRFDCALDPWDETLETGNGATTTDEFSCNVVQPHRVRSRERFIENQVGGVPRLAGFPRLRSEDGSSLITDPSPRGFRNPRMLAVPMADDDEAAEVQVGPTKYTASPGIAAELVVDPARSENSSLLLPIAEPRAYARHSGDASVTYEGLVRGLGYGMISVVQGQELTKRSALADLPASRPYGVLHEGSSAQLCRAGVEDEVLMAERAAELYSTAQSDLSEDEYSRAFGHYYGDYAELIEDLKPESHPYWSGGGETCGASSGQGVNGRRVCELVFGAEGEGQRARGFRILRAFDHELVIEPRFYSNSNERAALLELSNCCFPDASAYIIRASQHWLYREGSSPLHQIGVGSDSVCERDTSPLYEHLNNRIFEVSCDGDDCAGIGPSAAPNTEASEANAGADWVPACVLSSGGDPPIQPDSVMQNCVFDSLTARFAIYRGQEQSQRGMTFSWRIGGGFLPFSVSLVDINRNSSSTSNPQRLFFNSELQRIVITDGAPPGAGVAPAVTLLGLENRDGSPTITQSRISAF